MEKNLDRKEWEYPDYTRATEDQILAGLLALKGNQTEEDLIRAEKDIPKRKEEKPE